MSAGLPYFAWIDADEDTFESEHLRWDENVFSFNLTQDEGDPASLTVVVRRPRNEAGDAIGLLGPGRKIWCWFALDCGPDLIRFRGRLVGVPTSIFEELVTLEFVARPFDVVAQKEVLAETLRVLPHYDAIFIDPPRRADPEVVLEGYTANWHYDRETHILTISDEITGEDGLVEFDGVSDGGTVLYDGLGLTLTSGPLSRVDVSAEFSWTQGALGQVDLTEYLIAAWNAADPFPIAQAGAIASYSFTADNWPKNGTGLGDGWEVAESTAIAAYDLQVHHSTEGGTQNVKWPDGGKSTLTVSYSKDFLSIVPSGSIVYDKIVTRDISSTTHNSFRRSFTAQSGILPLHHTIPTLRAAYTAERPFNERVTFSLFADVQHVLTDPEDGEALRLDDIRSINLSEEIDGEVPMVDSRRRSYIATERGNRSLEHLIALARAHLMKRARVIEIEFAPKLSRMPEITLRKSAVLVEPRVGEAVGKIIGYSLALDGSDGRINCAVKIGCAIGRGGTVAAVTGTPTYCSVDYTGADYQQFNGRTVLVDTSVGYQPPQSDPNDDGVDFLSALKAEDVIEVGLTVQNNASEQFDYIVAHVGWPSGTLGQTSEELQAVATARAQAVNNALKEVPTRATFKLKSMSREFLTDYEVQVTDLKIPAGYDLETV